MNQSVSAGCCSPPCSLHTPHHHPPSEGQGVCQGRTLPLARTLYTLQTMADLSWLFFSTSVHFCVDIQNYVKHHFFCEGSLHIYISTKFMVSLCGSSRVRLDHFQFHISPPSLNFHLKLVGFSSQFPLWGLCSAKFDTKLPSANTQ